MADMTYTEDQVRALREALTSGVLTVSYDGKSVTYRSVDEIKTALAEIEAAAVHELRTLLRAPEVVVATWRAARERDGALTETEVRDALQDLVRCGRSCSPPSRPAWSSSSSGASRSTRRG